MKTTLSFFQFFKLASLACVVSPSINAQISPQTNAATSATWSSVGQSLANTRQQPNETTINVSNVKNLKVKWSFTTDGDVSATPTVLNGVVYAPDWAGNLFALNATSGLPIWRHQISEYNKSTGSISRVSPLVLSNEIVIGDNVASFTAKHAGANIIAVNPSTGNLMWITQVDSHPAAIITGSPVALNNVIYVGVSSIEEGLAAVPGYPCCTFQGSVVALDAGTGKILWKTVTIPSNGGSTNQFSGGAVWQPPAIDPARSLLYVGTGDNYTVTAGTEQCEIANLASGNTASCTNSNDHIDSVLALDLATGKIKWATKVLGYDTFNVDCLIPAAPGGTPCPSPAGPDLDFPGSGPNLVGNILGIGQKSGTYWAFNPDTGAILWSTAVGPGGAFGEMWGTASDGTNIYLPITDPNKVSYTLTPGGKTITWGSWAALNVQTGKIVWQTADPTTGAIDMSGMSVANGVVFTGSMSGTMYALNAQTGQILWSFPSGGSVLDAPSIVNGTLYWGSGYGRLSAFFPSSSNNKIYAFSF
jgi:polyvinyl alcohol dehydrogenase (cytochrome)